MNMWSDNENGLVNRINEKKKMNRRNFLKQTGGTVCTANLFYCLPHQHQAKQPKIGFVESNYGDKNQLSDKVLVAYASRCGSTGKVADLIGRVLNTSFTAVDVRLVENVKDIASYRAVIIGSAIRYDEWLPEAVDFIKTHSEYLSSIFTSYFITCMALVEDTERNRRNAKGYLKTVREIMEPTQIGMFAGKLELSKLTFFERMIYKVFKIFGVQEGDFRNWVAIRVWAEKIQSEILRFSTYGSKKIISIC